MTEEIRSVDPDTGAEKGTKLARHSLIPPNALTEIAEHYGRGSQKYADNNWRKGYKWSLSYDALCRHLAQFWDGEDYDEETGSKHIIAVAWHAIALSVFMDEQRDKDDRFQSPNEACAKPTVTIYVNSESLVVPDGEYISYDEVLEAADAYAGSTVVWSSPGGGGGLLTRESDSLRLREGMSFTATRTDNA